MLYKTKLYMYHTNYNAVSKQDSTCKPLIIFKLIYLLKYYISMSKTAEGDNKDPKEMTQQNNFTFAGHRTFLPLASCTDDFSFKFHSTWYKIE